MNQQSLEKMGTMRLLGMQLAFKSFLDNPSPTQFTHDELIHHLLQSEWEDRRWRMQQRYIKNASFRYQATLEQLDYTDDRGLDKTFLQRLSTCEFIKKGSDLFITGSTGTGKSFLASALGYQACLLGYKVLYANTIKLMSQLKIAKGAGTHLKHLDRIEKQDVLILDDFGVQPLDAGSRALLLDIIEDRHAKRTTIITSQLPVKKWHEVTYLQEHVQYFFWRNYNQQEIDLIELKQGQLHAYAFKYSNNKRVKVPAAFSTAYPTASFECITKDNYLDWITRQ